MPNRDESHPSERRHRRSGCLADALRLQLEACRADEGLAAIVVSDDLGFCVAQSGADRSHEEIAARLPMLADPAQRGSAGVDDDGLQAAAADLTVTTFSAGGARLHACAVNEAHGPSTARDVQALDRVASGFSRMLGQ